MPKQRKSDPPTGDKPKRRSPRFKPETLARRAVIKAQRETKQYIPFTSFNRLVHDVLGAQNSPAVHIRRKAVEALWTEAEAMLVDMFRAAAGVADTCKRVKLTDRHIRNALRSADIIARTSYFRRVWARPEGTLAPHLQPPVTPEIEVEEAPLVPVVAKAPVKPKATKAVEKTTTASSTASKTPKKKEKTVSSSSDDEDDYEEPTKTKKAGKSKRKKKKSHQCKYASVDPYGLKANTQRAIDRGRYGEPEYTRRMLARGFKLPAYRAGSSSSSATIDSEEEYDEDDDEEEELDLDASQRNSLLTIARAQEQDFRRAIDEKAQMRYQNEVAAIRERSRQLAPIVKDVTYMVKSSLK